MTLLPKLIPLFPLLGFILCGTVGKRMSRAAVGALATLSVAISFVCALLLLRGFVGGAFPNHHFETTLWQWMPMYGGGAKPLDVAFLVDPLSLTLTLVITGVGALIHFYAMGYMAQDARYSRFFSLLNLFVFFMLLLVLGNSFPMMFVGWEGVGLCSYLLIGFWFEDMANAAAGTKAFIVNRVGDFGFLAAMMWMFSVTGSLRYADVFANAGMFTASALIGVTLLLFLGATGKSAQIPLYVWLPDAMAGPTPVSALIHAATMVTAGVYMVARCHVLFSAAPTTQAVVSVIGVLTAFFAATIAMVQFDMKKVLAYSTVSQLGYMFVGVGTGAYAAGVFHLFTHAFFKACLFLGAGAVMHGMANNIDLRYMGNLKKYMPATRRTYFVAVLAIAGIPPLAGFFSKDDILAAAFDKGHTQPLWLLVYALGLATAFLTALYMMRSYLMAFEGEERIDWKALKAASAHGHGHGHGADAEGAAHRPVQAEVTEHDKAHLIHELPGMSVVLYILAAFSTVVGFLFGISALFPNVLPNLSFERWLEPALGAWWAQPAVEAAAEAAPAHAGSNHLLLAGVSFVVAALGIFSAFALEKARKLDTSGVPQPLYNALFNKYKVDELYGAIFQTGGKALSAWMWQVFDARVIDGFVNGVGAATKASGAALRRWSTGYARSYAFSILAGVIIIIGYLLFHHPTWSPAAAAIGRGAF